MNRDQKIKEIREACIRANPEIVELEFGCFLSVKGRGDYRSLMCFIDKSVAGNYICSPWVKRAGTTTVKPENVEIIGRDIRLADVLNAVRYLRLKEAVMIDQEGGFVTVLAGQPPLLHSVFKGWNLLKDRLEDQSDETVSFIHSLLANAQTHDTQGA